MFHLFLTKELLTFFPHLPAFAGVCQELNQSHCYNLSSHTRPVLLQLPVNNQCDFGSSLNLFLLRVLMV